MKNKNQPNKPCWIETIDDANASEELTSAYQQVGAVHGKIHNLYKAFSLQPKPLVSADQHYRDVLHNESNESEPWFLELLASQVAIISKCHYALENHSSNFRRLLGNDEEGQKMLAAVKTSDFDDNLLFTEKQSTLLKFGEKLSRNPEHMVSGDIDQLHNAGVSDTEILEAVQTIACFAYWTRFINGLGISLGDESVGLFDELGNRRGTV
jgi:uncharacterized peroxidase-related enzyme